MQMSKMSINSFKEYVLDTRKSKLNSKAIDVYFYNPVDCVGKPSSFVFVVLVSKGKNHAIYCAGSKRNPTDDEFSISEGLRQACTRAWREYQGMPSLYGKDRTPKRKRPSSYYLRRLAEIMGTGFMNPIQAHKRMLTAKKEDRA
jgi:hypothetical protein